MNARDRWLTSFASDYTRHTYEQVFAEWWTWAKSRYLPLLSSTGNIDPLDWLVDHRRRELKSPAEGDHIHCEKLVAEWYESLKKSDLDPSSRDTYLAVVRSFFNHLLPRDAGSLRLPLEPSDVGS